MKALIEASVMRGEARQPAPRKGIHHRRHRGQKEEGSLVPALLGVTGSEGRGGPQSSGKALDSEGASSCLHQAGDDVVNGDRANGAAVLVDYGEHPEVVLVKQFENVFFAGVGGRADERIGLELPQEFVGHRKQHAGNGDRAGEVAELVEKNDGIELLEVEVLVAEPLENFVSGCGLTDERKFGIHHTAGGGRVEGEKLAHFGGFLVWHFLKEFFGGFLGKVGQEVSRSVGRHFLDDVGRFFGIQLFDDLRREALVELGKNCGGGFFVERGNDALALGGRELFHHLGEVGGVEILELFMRDTKFHATKRIRLDKVDELPTNGALRKFALEPADEHRGGNPLQKASDGTGQADVDLSDAKLHIAVGALFGEIDVVDTDHFAAGGVDDLLVEKIFLDREPGFVGLIGAKSPLTDAEVDAARGNFGDLVVAGHEGLEASTGDEKVGDAIGLLGGFNEEFADAADVVRLVIIGGGAHEFGDIEQAVAPF